MQLLANAEQMRAIDRTAIDHYGIAGLILMENAGRAFVDILHAHHPLRPGARVVIMAGHGNNGGDGFVIARHLLNRGCRVDVLCLPGELSADARTNREVLERIASDRLKLIAIKKFEEVGRILSPEVIVDAMFGTGFSGKLSGLALEFSTWASLSGAYIAAVDIASGVEADEGRVEGSAVKADLTVCMGLAKTGHYLGEGRNHSGIVVVADIGIPHAAMAIRDEPVFRFTREDIPGLLPSRKWDANKYDVGKVLVVAGSRSFTGAAVLAADAALVGGAGAAILAAPESLHSILASKLTEVIIRQLPETADGTIAQSALPDIRSLLAWADAVVVGPGLGRNAETDALVRLVVRESPKPLILDADGLNAFVDAPEELKDHTAPLVLTPHAGELGRLRRKTGPEIEATRIRSARESAREFGATVVLKGAPTATASPDGKVVLNSSGNSGMATIGSGDVLTGLIASFTAQGMSSTDAAVAGVYLHGRAGDIARDHAGERSMRARDILRSISEAFVNMEN